MDVTARQISDWARESMRDMADDPRFGTLTAVYDALAKQSGLSSSWVAKFYQGAKPNPTQDTLDRLVAAIKRVTAKPQAA